MIKNKIITNDGYAQFIWGDGTSRIHETACDNVYATFFEDTVSFVLIGLPKSSGLALFTTRAADLELNGVTYSVADLPDAVAEAFAPGSLGIHFEIVDELPEVGEGNVIYLVPSAESGSTDYYTEYIWLETEERYEKIGTTDGAELNVPIWKDINPGTLKFNHSGNKATAVRASAFGYETVASGVDSLVMGDRCSGTSNGTFAQGYFTQATAPHAVALGDRTIASGQDSFAQGMYAKATNNIEFSVGRHNVSHKASNDWGDSGNTLFSIGNGSTSGTAHNALEVRQNGDIYLTLDGQDVNLQDVLESKADSDDVYLKTETSSKTEISDALALKSDTSHTHVLSAITDVTATVAAVNSLSGEVGSMAFENKTSYSSATEVATALGSGFTLSSVTEVIESNEKVIANALNDLEQTKLDIDDFNTLSGTVSAHTADTDIHITSAERTAWNDKIDTSAITTSISSSSTDAQVPSAKCLYDTIGDIETLLSQI